MLINAPIRGTDRHGSGAFGASRGGRTHQGIDISCCVGSGIFSVSAGTVTKIGYPYNPGDIKKGHLRYVQVTDGAGFDVRYFYILPKVMVGQKVGVNSPIGISQGLTLIYPGITDHFHFEVKKGGEVINPHDYLNAL